VTGPRLTADFAGAFPELVREWQPTLPALREDADSPQMYLTSPGVADDLGLDPSWLHSQEALAALGARGILPESQPVSQAYAGSQFDSFSPLLGDGRAVLLGEITTPAGEQRDLALKGSGRTPFSRGGDGRAVLGPALREHLFGEVMAALGLPTTRVLAVVTTGDRVFRDGGMSPGAVLTRVAASHLRVGTFELVARSMSHESGADILPRLVAYAAARHFPDVAPPGPDQACHLLAAVAKAQATLMAGWVAVGFLHGVMNTDNMALSGETIDYGPCAWLEAYDPDAVFSSIDSGGRYRFRNQAPIALWNLSRFAESLLPLIDPSPDRAVDLATEVLDRFQDDYEQARLTAFRAKLGLTDAARPGDAELIESLLGELATNGADYTLAWRHLADALTSGEPIAEVSEGWMAAWQARVPGEPAAVAEAMNRTNPLYVPRNHLVEAALEGAAGGERAAYDRLVEAVRSPYAAVPGQEDLASPAPPGFTARHVTYCGT
jgi:serine/tyrosine/threonine adenylyltransferase